MKRIEQLVREITDKNRSVWELNRSAIEDMIRFTYRQASQDAAYAIEELGTVEGLKIIKLEGNYEN